MASRRRTPTTRRRSIGSQVRSQSQRLLETGRRFERFDQIRQRHFWSTAFWDASGNGYMQGKRQFFITPPGQNGQGFPSGVTLTERETNWKSANRVPDNQNFEVTELGVTAMFNQLDIDVDGTLEGEVPLGFVLNNFLQNAVVSITYLTNSVPLGMASDFGQAAGPQVGTYKPIQAAALNAPNNIGINGFAAPALRRRFKIPILLQHGETFSFDITLPRAVLNPFDGIYVRLDFFATESFAEKS